jgi:hypothetical protein
VTSSILLSSPTSDRDSAPGDGLPFPGTPAGDQPMDPAGSLGFRYQPYARDLLLAPGGAAALSHIDNGHTAFAGGDSSSASTTSTFRDSIRRPRAPAVYASDLALPRRLQDSLLACLIDFDQAGLSPANWDQLSQRAPPRAQPLRAATLKTTGRAPRQLMSRALGTKRFHPVPPPPRQTNPPGSFPPPPRRPIPL